MKTLIIRADDLGISEAVNLGIYKSIKDGLIRSVGLMPNMPEAKNGYELIKEFPVSVGQHTNVCLGKPCADPTLIPNMLDENGDLKSSKVYREAFKNGVEVAPVEELVIEVEAQYKRFIEIVGHKPSYFEAHAVASKNLAEALKIVAERYDLYFFDITIFDKQGEFKGKPIAMCRMDSMQENYDPYATLKLAVEEAQENMPNVFVCHPGYLDDYILNHSSLTINRTKEVTMLCDENTKQWLQQKQVQLINYDEV